MSSDNGVKYNKARVNRKVQKFFEDKVFIGIRDEPLKRKVYRGKRNKNGYRKNDIYYVNEKQDFRISESMLKEYVDYILSSLTDMDDTSVMIQSRDSKQTLFRIRQKYFLNKRATVEEYKDFISKQLSEDDNQSYLNNLVQRKIKERNFKDIIEKVEVYETGLVCILNNGFEISVRF